MLTPRIARRSLDIALLCALAAVAVTPRAEAALPAPSAKFVTHDHSTPGDEWHIEVTVSRDPRRVRQLVLHDERCRATVLVNGVAIAEDGGIDATAPYTSRGRRGTWSLAGIFTDPGHLSGAFRLCESSERTFDAHAEGHHGAGGHAHHGHQHVGGTPPGQYADLSGATPRRRAQARRLWRASVRASRSRFSTYRRARRLRFVPSPGLPSRRPQLFHLRHHGYAATPGSFDARHPESLVYWNPSRRGTPVLLGFMYRLAPGPRPRFAAPLLGWHSHSARTSQMTHVWLTRDLRSALANCMPVSALERAIPRYRYDVAGRPESLESIPCPEEGSS